MSESHLTSLICFQLKLNNIPHFTWGDDIIVKSRNRDLVVTLSRSQIVNVNLLITLENDHTYRIRPYVANTNELNITYTPYPQELVCKLYEKNPILVKEFETVMSSLQLRSSDIEVDSVIEDGVIYNVTSRNIGLLWVQENIRGNHVYTRLNEYEEIQIMIRN